MSEYEDLAAARKALKAGEVAGIYTVDAAGTPRLTLLSSYDSSRASSVLTDRSILETVASSYTQNAELMSRLPRTTRRRSPIRRRLRAPCRSRAEPAA